MFVIDVLRRGRWKRSQADRHADWKLPRHLAKGVCHRCSSKSRRQKGGSSARLD